MKLPHIKDIRSLLITLKTTLGDEYRVEGDESGLPCMNVTIRATEDGDWDYHTGNPSYIGEASIYPAWGEVTLYHRSDCTWLARDLVDQIADQLADQIGED